MIVWLPSMSASSLMLNVHVAEFCVARESGLIVSDGEVLTASLRGCPTCYGAVH